MSRPGYAPCGGQPLLDSPLAISKMVATIDASYSDSSGNNMTASGSYTWTRVPVGQPASQGKFIIYGPGCCDCDTTIEIGNNAPVVTSHGTIEAMAGAITATGTLTCVPEYINSPIYFWAQIGLGGPSKSTFPNCELIFVPQQWVVHTWGSGMCIADAQVDPALLTPSSPILLPSLIGSHDFNYACGTGAGQTSCSYYETSWDVDYNITFS